MERKNIILIIKIVLWIGGLYLCAWYSLHTLYFIISGFYFIFTNMGTRKKGTLSAYSVFNENFQKLPGTMDGMSFFKGGMQQQPQKLVLQTHERQTETIISPDRQEYFKNQSKYSNKPCFCGSSIKFKKCCLATSRKQAEQQRIKRIKAN